MNIRPALLQLSLLAITTVATPLLSTAQKFERKGNTVTYRGNTFEISPERVDTVIETDKTSGDEMMKIIHRDGRVIKMNDAPVYMPEKVMLQPAFLNGSFEETVLKGMLPDLNKLPDGVYRFLLFNVIVGPKGKVVYYEFPGVEPGNIKIKVPPAINKSINQKLDAMFSKGPLFKPGKVNGYTVAVDPDVVFYHYSIEVKKHKATVIKKQ